MTRNTKGCLIIVLPPIVLVVVGVLYVFGVLIYTAFSTASSGQVATGAADLSLNWINGGLSFIGIFSMVAIPVCFIVGLIYILTAPKPPSDTNTQTPA